MPDSTTDDAMLDEWERRSTSHLADPGLFDFANLAIGAASPHNDPENP